MATIESVDGTKKDVNCIGCAINNGDIERFGGIILETEHFDIQQDYEIPIVGFFVLASKRHIIGFHDFNEEEKKEFMDLVCKLRKGMKEILAIEYITLLFREEIIVSKVNPSHFHIAFLPKEDWMKGKNIREILEYAKENFKTEENLSKVKEVVDKIKEYMN